MASNSDQFPDIICGPEVFKVFCTNSLKFKEVPLLCFCREKEKIAVF